MILVNFQWCQGLIKVRVGWKVGRREVGDKWGTKREGDSVGENGCEHTQLNMYQSQP